MHRQRYAPLEPPTTVTPSLTMMQQAFSRVQQRLGPSSKAAPALSTVTEQSETSSIMSGDRMSEDTVVGNGHKYQELGDNDEYEETENGDPFLDVRRVVDGPATIESRVLRYANEALETVPPNNDSRPISAIAVDPIRRPNSAWTDASSSIATQSTGATYLEPTSNTSVTPKKPIDHFKHDTEAYASGTYRSPSQVHRSRSPTPAPDEEDYQITSNGAVQYTGYTSSTAYTEDTDYADEKHYGYTMSYDAEKAALSRDIAVVGTLPYYGAYRPSAADAYSEKTASTLTTSADEESMYTTSRFSQVSGYSEPQSPFTTRHFGPAPTGRMQRRLGHKRRVPLVNGHLTVDLDVPDRLKNVIPLTSAGKGTEETSKLRYTAVMGDPDDFPKSYWLRQNQYQRTTEMFIVITMYNVSRWCSRLCMAAHVSIPYSGICRKMRNSFVAPYTASCAISRTYVLARTREHGVRMHGRRCFCATIFMPSRR